MTENNRILIADDNPANCELLQAYLEDVDCQIELAIDGQDTLDQSLMAKQAGEMMDASVRHDDQTIEMKNFNKLH